MPLEVPVESPIRHNGHVADDGVGSRRCRVLDALAIGAAVVALPVEDNGVVKQDVEVSVEQAGSHARWWRCASFASLSLFFLMTRAMENR